MTETQTLYKLIILYMLNRVTFPLSNSQLSEFILEKEYTDYFTLQQTIHELTESKLIRQEAVHNATLYRITEEGRTTLTYFVKKISSAIRKDIDTFLSEHKYELRNEHSTPADYYRTTTGEFAAHCRVLERDSVLMDLTLTVPVEAQAKAICDHWKGKSQEIYATLIQSLL
ncbi:DUF4364 family protein [bacterium 1XD21-13]|nr:DUF4364 family protein [bacterium 1XD21-13]